VSGAAMMTNTKKKRMRGLKTIIRENTEIRTQFHLMDAGGTADVEPIESEIKALLIKDNYNANSIKIWWDEMQGLWRWWCKILPLDSQNNL